MPRSRDPVISAVTSIRQLVRALRLGAQRTQSAAGISAAQLFVLQQLQADDCLSLSELAARTLTDRSSVADVVERLDGQGLLVRTTDPADRRRAAVTITARGRRLLSRAPAAPTTELIAALRRMSPRDRAALAQSLERLTMAWGVADDPAPMFFADDDRAQAKNKRPVRARV